MTKEILSSELEQSSPKSSSGSNEATDSTPHQSTAETTQASAPTILLGRDLVREMGLLSLIKEDYNTHRRTFFSPGFQAMVVYRFGTRVDNLGDGIIKSIAKFFYEIGFRYICNFYGIEIYKTVQVGRRLQLVHQHGIVIHRYAKIEDDVIIRHSVTFGQGAEWVEGEGPYIGSRVEFGPGTVVMGNITIGDDVSIGPNCTISSNIPSNRTLFVPPPRVIPKANPENPDTQ